MIGFYQSYSSKSPDTLTRLAFEPIFRQPHNVIKLGFLKHLFFAYAPHALQIKTFFAHGIQRALLLLMPESRERLL
jgi:hypothetical protein